MNKYFYLPVGNTLIASPPSFPTTAPSAPSLVITSIDSFLGVGNALTTVVFTSVDFTIIGFTSEGFTIGSTALSIPICDVSEDFTIGTRGVFDIVEMDLIGWSETFSCILSSERAFSDVALGIGLIFPCSVGVAICNQIH